LTPALALLLALAADPETVIRAPRAPDDADARFLDEDARGSAAPEEALEEIEGVALTRDGGPLAPARVTRRGLSGARAPVTLEGVPLGDPAGGGVDVAGLPWGLLDTATLGYGMKRALALGLRSVDEEGEGWDARFGAGSFGTVRGDAAWRSRAGGRATSFGAFAATTRGDFPFSLETPSGTRLDGVRAGNEQLRLGGLARSLGERSDFVIFASFKEGGTPGFATAPLNLRSEQADAGARASASLGDVTAGVTLRAARRATAGRAVTSGLATADLAWSPRDLGVRFAATGGVDGALEPGAVRPRLGAQASGAWRAPGWSLEVEGGAGLVGDALVPGGRVDLGFGVGRAGRVGARLSRTARAPTLDELHAPGGFVVGNADLRPEGASDAEVYTAWRLGRVVRARAALWGGRMDDAILFLNRNAFEVQPVNTGGAWRSGVEGSVSVRPHALAELSLVGDAMWSRLDATGAPLPVAPAIRALLRASVGTDEARLEGRLRARGASTTNLFGTLAVPAYAMVDIAGRLRLSPSLGLSAELRNALDARDARDANLLPLPGRALFVSLEVRS
jgi:hypothetical protein